MRKGLATLYQMATLQDLLKSGLLVAKSAALSVVSQGKTRHADLAENGEILFKVSLYERDLENAYHLISGSHDLSCRTTKVFCIPSKLPALFLYTCSVLTHQNVNPLRDGKTSYTMDGLWDLIAIN